jgi:GTP-binding protein
LFKGRIKFVKGAAHSDFFLQNETTAEIAFVGRSNVGKSSLLNALTHSTSVKCSDKPGTTRYDSHVLEGVVLEIVDTVIGFQLLTLQRTINWFQTQASKFFLVDLPG